MDINWELVKDVAIPILILVIGIGLDRSLRRRPKLIAHYGHVSVFRSRPDGKKPIDINTHSVVIRNEGNKTANNVKVMHDYLPDDINVFPSVEYSVRVLPDGSKELIFPMLIPKEEITISYLYYPPVTFDQIVTNVKSDEGAAKVISVWYAPIIAPMYKFASYYFVIAGLFATLYILIIILLNFLESL